MKVYIVLEDFMDVDMEDYITNIAAVYANSKDAKMYLDNIPLTFEDDTGKEIENVEYKKNGWLIYIDSHEIGDCEAVSSYRFRCVEEEVLDEYNPEN